MMCGLMFDIIGIKSYEMFDFDDFWFVCVIGMLCFLVVVVWLFDFMLFVVMICL